MSCEADEEGLKRRVQALEDDVKEDELAQTEKKPRHDFFDMNLLVQNSGLQHIAVRILRNLDIKNLKDYRQVSKGWKTLIDNEVQWWRHVLQLWISKTVTRLKASQSHRRLRANSEFSGCMSQLSNSSDILNIKVFGRFLLDYSLSKVPSWDTPLHYAVEKNRLDIFQKLARSRYFKNFNIENVCGSNSQWHRTLVGDAVVLDRVEIVELLMNLEGEKKIDFTNVAYNGYTLFHDACRAGSTKVVELFLDRAKVLKLRLDLGAILEAKSKPVLELLLNDLRIDVEATDYHGHTVLHKVMSYNSEEQEDIYESTELLLNSPRIDISVKDKYGKTALDIACVEDDAIKVEAFLRAAKKRNIDVNIADKNGFTFVHLAFVPTRYFYIEDRLLQPFTLKEFSPVIEIILNYTKELSIDLEAKNSDGRTPLHYLYQTRSKANVTQFLEAVKNEYNIQFNLNVTDNEGFTPQQLSKQE